MSNYVFFCTIKQSTGAVPMLLTSGPSQGVQEGWDPVACVHSWVRLIEKTLLHIPDKVEKNNNIGLF